MKKFIDKFVAMILATLLIIGCSPDNQNKLIKEPKLNVSTPIIKNISHSNQESRVNSKSIEEILNNFLEKEKIIQNNVSIVLSDEEKIYYSLNPKKIFFAASTYKLPLAMLYYEKGIDLDTNVLLSSSNIESGVIANNYSIGNYIPISDFIRCMIVYSDNTAGNTLYKFYGGWSKFLKDVSNFSNEVDYYSISKGDNYINAQYLNDTLRYLYKNSDTFNELIIHLKNATTNRFLNLDNIGVPIAQKYGNYDNNLHITGIVYGKHPYFITILTNNMYDQEQFIGKVNRLIFDYFNK